MSKYNFGQKSVSVIPFCGEEKALLMVDKEQVRSAEQLADALGVTKEEVLRFLFPEGQTEVGSPLLCIRANRELANIRVLCLLGYAGAKARECRTAA